MLLMHLLCYTVAAEEVVWDYAPSGYNNYDNTTLDEGNAAVFLTNTKATIGRKYKKAQYIEYTDANFTTVKPTPEWLGNVGPIIRAEVHYAYFITTHTVMCRYTIRTLSLLCLLRTATCVSMYVLDQLYELLYRL
jgi:hypothetical protein